jgi:Xaa-Pro aminopeptidase
MENHVSISSQEYKARLAKARELLLRTDLDALLVTSNEAEFANVRYFSNYWPIFEMAGVLIPRQGEPILLIGPESETYAYSRSEIPCIRKLLEYREPADPEYPGVKVSTFKEVFSEAGIPNPQKIGIAGYLVTTLPILDGLKENFPELSYVRADDIMVKLRSVKSPVELECLRQSFQISEVAIDAILERIKPGMTELQVVGIAQQVIYENGAEYEGMPQYVLSGKRSNNAISRSTHTVLKKGDLVQLNISARVDGYSSGVGRPICLGKMTPRMKQMVEFGKLAHEKTMEWMKVGCVASEVAKKYQQLFIDHGYEDNFLYGPCHGLGMIEVEPPWMEITSNYLLLEDMTFNVDTFVQERDFGLRWENGVRITSAGVEVFSNRNMRLIEID